MDIGELAGERSDDDGDVVDGWTMVAGRSRNVCSGGDAPSTLTFPSVAAAGGREENKLA